MSWVPVPINRVLSIYPAAVRLAAAWSVVLSTRRTRLIKGYGDTHARGQATFDAIRGDLVTPALNGEAPAAQNIAEARERALNDRPA
jgi:hypothetical protein